MLLTGPDLLCNLLGVVCRFREKRYPISADIEGMYMQVSVRPDDRKFLRFLWGTDKPDFYEYTRFVFGAKCSPTCAIYALRKCADDNVNTHPHIRDIVYNNFYMDNFFESTDSIEEALRLYQDLRAVLKLGGFNLTKWTSTSKDILDEIAENHRDIAEEEMNQPKTLKRILGIRWKIQTDALYFATDKIENLATQTPTQRQLLKTTASIFDPLGIASPITIRLRILQQQIWRKGLKWDDIITQDILPDFFSLLKERHDLQPIEIPRHYFEHRYDQVDLHVFSDASYAALAAVAYFVYHNFETKESSVSFVIGKARVAPLKQHTITKLELQAAVFGSRIARFLKKEQRIHINDVHMWTDSSTTLQWIRNSEQRQQIFVAHRVSEILENTQAAQWRPCPGEVNPADDGTRGIPFADFRINCRWFKGPSFLLQPKENWPQQFQPASTQSVDAEYPHDISMEEPLYLECLTTNASS